MKPNLKVFAGLFALLLAAQAQAMRWYSPSTGHWFSRDPTGEWGGVNTYCFLSNDPTDNYDALGLLTVHPYEYVYDVDFPDEGTLGETVPAVSQTGETVGCGFLGWKSKLTGYSMDLKITIKYAKGVVPGNLVPSKARTAEQHEKMHAQNAIDYATQVDQILFWLNERCLCDDCYKAVMRYAHKANELYSKVAAYKDAKLDCDDYRPASPARIKRCGEAATSQGELPSLQNTARNAFNEAKKACGWK